MYTEECLLLPVEEWLVAQKPVPLPVDRVGHGQVGKHRAGLVVRVEARDAVIAAPVAERLGAV